MIVVDASVAAKWIFTEDFSLEARDLLRVTLGAAEAVVAPPFLPTEVTNIIRQRMRREGLSLQAAQARLGAFLAIPVDLRTPGALYRRALEISDERGLPATYDAHYVALAEILGCVLWTDDQRLLKNLAGSLPYVQPISGYRSS